MDYIRHYWISENGPTVSRDLARKVKEAKQGPAQALRFIQDLQEHAPDYQALFSSPLEHSRLDLIGQRGRGYVAAVTTVLGIEQIRPLMLAVLRTFEPQDAKDAFRQMLSWSVDSL